MQVNDAKTMAIKLMREHGIWPEWSFGWNRRKTALGLCEYSKKRISLSSFHVTDNDEESVRNTILHEIAHAKAGPTAGHGPKWRAIFISLGGNGERCGESEANISYAWVGKCSNGHQTKQHRAPLRVKSCGRCAATFKPEAVMSWYKNGVKVSVSQMPVRYAQEALHLRNKYANRLPI